MIRKNLWWQRPAHEKVTSHNVCVRVTADTGDHAQMHHSLPAKGAQMMLRSRLYDLQYGFTATMLRVISCRLNACCREN
jgi:hypothetical protein